MTPISKCAEYMMKFKITKDEYRKAYKRWLRSNKLGHDISLDECIKNKDMKIFKVISRNKTIKIKTEPTSYQLNQFNITISGYRAMFQSQSGCCAICNIHQDYLKKRLSIDHCHKTNKVRGLLCAKCNTALGFIDDNLNTAKMLTEYLLKSIQS